MTEIEATGSSSRGQMPALMEIGDVAALMRISPSLLAKWRMRGRGPPFIKAGRRILYECAEVRRWLREQTRSSTAD